MKELKINKEIEGLVEEMFLVGQRCKSIKKEYPTAWTAILAQFDIDAYSYQNFSVSPETFKYKLYIEILRQKELDEKRKVKEINNMAKNITTKKKAK